MADNKLSPSAMCFGLSLEMDRQSFSCFLQLAGRSEFAELLASRLDEGEIERFVDTFTGMLKKHITKTEYHRFFLNDHGHQENAGNTE